MGILAYIPTVIAGIAVYTAYGGTQNSTESDTFALKTYLKSYVLAIMAVFLGLALGGLSIINGDFVSGGVGLLTGIGGGLIVPVIAVFDVGGKAAKQGAEFAKENPEQAAAMASAAAEVGGKAAEIKQRRDQKKAQDQREKERQQAIEEERKEEERKERKMERKKRFADFSMKCPSCGQDWIYNSGGLMSGQERVGYQYVGYDEVLEKTEVQCSNCSTAKSVQRSENI